MLRKRFYVKIELQLHAITCPGVWLCSHGYLEATIKTLGYFFRTGAMEPRFPLLCHDQFTMEGYFKSVGSLEELEKVLAAEQVEITLWQNGRRLAHFLGKLSDVMQQSCLPKLSCMHNVNVQLLLKPSPSFPGIIAPKAELSAQVGVSDRSIRTANPLFGLGRRITGSITKCSSQKSSNNNFITPHFDTNSTVPRGCQQSFLNGVSTGGSCLSYMKEKRRQRPVCHAARSTSSNFTPATSCHCSNTKSQLESQAQRNDLRRLSACSSHLSNFSYMTIGETSADGSSKCSHSLVSSNGDDRRLEMDHQECCKICRLYKKVFQVPMKFY